MSEYVRWLNLIKTQATPDWLTDSQRRVYDDLLARWQTSPFVCLCGPAGSGKTFIARLLAAHAGIPFAQAVSEIPEGANQAVLDGPEYSRALRPQVQQRGLRRVIIVLRQPPADPMPRAELTLTERDVGQFRGTLTRHHVITHFTLTAEGLDLGRILRQEAIEQGGRSPHAVG